MWVTASSLGSSFLHLMAAVVSVTIFVLLEHSRGVDVAGTTQHPQFIPVAGS